MGFPKHGNPVWKVVSLLLHILLCVRDSLQVKNLSDKSLGGKKFYFGSRKSLEVLLLEGLLLTVGKAHECILLCLVG